MINKTDKLSFNTNKQKELPANKCLWLHDELFYWHQPGNGAGYMPVTVDIQPLPGYSMIPDLRRAESLLKVSGYFDYFVSQPVKSATDDELRLVHTSQYIHSIETRGLGTGTQAGPYAQLGFHSPEAARRGAGAVVQAVDYVLQPDAITKRAYCFISPPGHHALPDQAMALCIYNNIAIAARYALRCGLERIFIIDIDVHHGNGTQSIFYESSQTYVLSIHQDGLFPPNSGKSKERGHSEGRNYTLNIPLPSGSGHGAYIFTMEEVVIPVIKQFQPDIILVSSGLDASAYDPMGRQLCTSQTYYEMSHILCKLADQVCDGRIIFIQEGGYSNWYLPFVLRSLLAGIVGLPLPGDPFLISLQHQPDQQLQPHQKQRIQTIIESL